MAVFQRNYQGLQKIGLREDKPHTQNFYGRLFLLLHQPWVICRYALVDAFKSRIFTIYFVLCFLPALVAMCVIYMGYNLEMLNLLHLPLDKLIKIDAVFFADWVQMPQMYMVFIMIMLVGPALISPDIGNNALPLYFSRPINKAGYIFGKLLVLLILGSVVTWVPGLLLTIFHASLSDDAWLFNNLQIPLACVMGSMIWIVSLSLLSLAVSAWVKWKAAARLFFFGLVWFSAALGNVVQYIFSHWIGGIFSLLSSLEVMLDGLYGIESSLVMPFYASIFVFLVLTLLSILLLTRRIRAFEVVS